MNLNPVEVADETTNVYEAHTLGELLIQDMHGKSVFDYKFQRKRMAKTMKAKSSVSMEGVQVQVDPQLFFQRLIIYIQPKEIEDAFSYELCTRPVSLFDSKGLMNVANKPALKKELFNQPEFHNAFQLISQTTVTMLLMVAHWFK